MLADLFVRGTIILATAAWVGAQYCRLRPAGGATSGRGLWTAGAALAVAHAIAAFHVVYGWSHEAAVLATARQTRAAFGVDWGGGVWVNYAFLALWAADAAWWWASAASYSRRPAAIGTAIFWVFLFMFVNGAVVFARGATRVFGAAAVAAAAWTWYRARLRADHV